MSAGRLIGLLLWKNWLIQRRRPADLATVLIVPLLFIGIVLLVRDFNPVAKSENGLEFSRFSVEWLPVNLALEATADGGEYRYLNDSNNDTVTPKWMIFYAPAVPGVDQVARLVAEKLDFEIRGFADEDEMLNFTVYNEHETMDLLCALVFMSEDFFNSTDIKYKLRFPKLSRMIWHTALLYPPEREHLPRERGSQTGWTPGYYESGFLAIQRAVDQAIVKTLSQRDLETDDIQLNLKRFPFPPYQYDGFFVGFMPVIAVLILFVFSFGIANLIADVVYEKEKMLKEYMEMIGLNTKLRWATWFLKYIIIFLLLTIFISVVFKVELLQGNTVLKETDASIVFLFLFLYSLSCITFGFLITAFFRKASRASVVGWLINFFTILPFFWVNDDKDPITMTPKVGLCFFHNMAMGFGWRVIKEAELSEEGLHWSTLGKAFGHDGFSIGLVLFMLLLDGILYGFFAFYFEMVIPSEYGISKPWYFICQRDYWRCGQKLEVPLVDEEADATVPPLPQSEYFEPCENHPAGVKLRNLTKVYKKSDQHKPAVDGASIDFHENEISILLGRSGAGKTTTLSMLSGVIEATAGTVLLNDVDVTNDLASARHCLGVCLQESVFFDKLTVEEHLIFIARLRGIRDSDVDQHVQVLIEGLDLTEHQDTLACKLSGGWRRKLAIAIAFVGDPKIVVLDEPSTGIDPEKRNQLWQFLQSKKQDRIIIVSTHALEEAELIGDRIAVMAEGVIHCYGSTLFLNTKYGCCYQLVMEKGPQCETSTVTDFVKEYIPDAQMTSDSGMELKYSLPQQQSSSFEKLLNKLDSQMGDLLIASYSISATTLDEVFMKISCPELDVKHGAAVADGDADGDAQPLLGSQEASSTKNTGATHNFQQLRAMLQKRFLAAIREKLLTIGQIILPLTFVFFAFLGSPNFGQVEDESSLELTFGQFPGFKGYYTSDVAELGLRYGRDMSLIFETVVENEGGMVKHVLKNKEYGPFQASVLENYILMESIQNFSKYRHEMMVAADFYSPNKSQGQVPAEKILAIDMLFNHEPYHTSAMALNVAGNLLLRFYLGISNITISTYNHPLPVRTGDYAMHTLRYKEPGTDHLYAPYTMICFTILVGSFSTYIVKERSLSSKHLQLTSGLHKVIFWVGHALWDFIIFFIVLILMLLLFTIFGKWGYAGVNSIFVMILLTSFMWAAIPLVYFLSKIFSVPASAYNWLTFLLTIVGLILATISSLAKAMPDGILTLILPNIAILPGMGYINSVSREDMICADLQREDSSYCEAFKNIQTKRSLPGLHPCCHEYCSNCSINFDVHHLSWGPLGIGHLVFMEIVVGIFWILVLAFFESNIWRIQETVESIRALASKKSTNRQNELVMLGYSRANEDEDVVAETQRIWSSTVEDLKTSEAVLVMGIKKRYGSKVAVNNVTFGVQPGECFGLLGANGAGKTTIFEILTRRTMMSSGQVFINGHNILTDAEEAYKCIGYCPQYDHLLPFMTPKETLVMYARIRGLAEKQIDKKIADILKILAIEDQANKRISQLSYGGRRRVSLAVALIGEPPILLLDEPTSGLDPVVRKRVWTMLSKCQEAGQTIILTSHSMEECEALCTRLAILINGEFKCLGSQQHLKFKFGQGYSVIGKIAAQEDENIETKTQGFISHINDTFTGSVLQDVHQGTVHYRIPTDVISLAQIFGVLERSKETHGLVEYCVSQATLEQVFLFLVRMQIPAGNVKREGFTFQRLKSNLRRCFNLRRT